MLTINLVNLNNNSKTKKQTAPTFGATLKITPDAFQAVENAFRANRLNPVSGSFFNNLKHFCSRAVETYKHFGLDGLKCLKSECFDGKTNLKSIARILAVNTEAASEGMPGKIILTQKPECIIRKEVSDFIPINPKRSSTPDTWEKDLFLYYKDNNLPYTYYINSGIPPEQYIPQSLNIHDLNKAVIKITDVAEETYATGRITKTDY